MEQLKRGFKIHHGWLRTRLMSIRSLLHYLSYQIYDRGITLTPSYVRNDEVNKYLVDEYGSEALEALRSYSFGRYESDNYLMLEFASLVVTNPDLKSDLDLLSSYYRTRETEKNISMYLSKKRSLKGNVLVKPFAKFEYGRVKFKGVNDLSYHDNYYTVGNAKEVFVSHIFYDALADYAGVPKNREWTFRTELTREQESKYIMLIIDGSIEPNTEVGRKVHDAYMEIVTTRTPNYIFEETYLRRLEEIDEVTQKILDAGKQIKGVTDYSVIYEDSGEEITHVPVYVGYYAWDNDYGEPLDDINRLIGCSGEFTREPIPDRLPYEVTIDGRTVDMYRVEVERENVDESYLFSSLQREYEKDIVEGAFTEKDYHISAENLEPQGFAYIGDDEYIRCLNATDLELNGDAIMYMANMHPKLNLRKKKKAVEDYHILQEEGEGDLQLKVKTVVNDDNEMFVKQHIKYYDESPTGERVVEGFVMLDDDLRVPDLYTLISNETMINLSEDSLQSKRVGVYVKEKESVYGYKFLIMFDTETKAITRVTDSIIGVSRRGSNIQSLTLRMLGLEEEKENYLREVVQKSIFDIVLNNEDNKEFYTSIMNNKELVLE